jgi:hypothetical protein
MRTFAARGRASRDAGLERQDFNTELGSEPLTDMSQFPGDKAGASRVELGKFKLIRSRADSGGCLCIAAFAVHD